MDHSCCAAIFFGGICTRPKKMAARYGGQVLSHHQLSSDTATEDDFFETVLL
jgi:hypothetical protein